jgi:hypothetical protein
MKTVLLLGVTPVGILLQSTIDRASAGYDTGRNPPPVYYEDCARYPPPPPVYYEGCAGYPPPHGL